MSSILFLRYFVDNVIKLTAGCHLKTTYMDFFAEKEIFHLFLEEESAVARFLFLKKQQNGKPSLMVSMCVGKGVKVFHVRIQLRFTTIVTY